MTELLAHRGTTKNSDGERVNEHTLAAYSASIDFGADYVEPDLYVTKDGVLVSCHDDIGFSKMTYEEALKKDPELAKFEDIVDMVKERSIETGRKIGISYEIKEAHTKALTKQAASQSIDTLVAKDFTDPDKVIINSFENYALRYLHDEVFVKYPDSFSSAELPLIELVHTVSVKAALAYIWDKIPFVSTAYAYSDIINKKGNEYIDGYALPKAFGVERLTKLADALHENNKELHIFTAEEDITDEKYEDLLNTNADAIYADNTETARKAFDKHNGMLDVIHASKESDNVDVETLTKVYAMQGDDTIHVSGDKNKVYGDGGDDMIISHGSNNLLNGGGGDDFIYSSGSENTIYAGAGNNVIYFGNDDIMTYDQEAHGNNLVVGDGEINIEGYNADDVSFINQEGNLIIQFDDGGSIIIQDGVDSNGELENKITIDDNPIDIDAVLTTGGAISPADVAQLFKIEVNGVKALDAEHIQ
ncbi:glycerophosphodiester phosphodiesterase family protein [Serratia rhizosphaerae]|uniref:GP-PDE domain-containing protein n=1 Tax=Serratia rhizosphaerae TaxID=2597702 RepID=A0ABX6GT45_9GAMM|nr:glycerophosphodiester phosphodiesterase family protein [Serratia rhizosphaerae]QHA89456.1 hypothetical protein FO014_22085 [Serratia rhizosphaerae]